MDDKTLENDVDVIDDLVLTNDQLYFNNTFNLKALNDTLEKISVVNFWNLYQAQRSRLDIEIFNIPFNEFLQTSRLMGEPQKAYYPKRYVSYVNYAFIDPELRKKYRNSEFYNMAINQKTIANNPSLFSHNYLVFIDGEFIFTTEAYPLESKTAIVIDVAIKEGDHGITYKQYLEYKESNPMVSIIMVPNYNMTDIGTNQYILENYNYKLPFANISGGENLTNDTICFVNSVEDIARRFYEDRISCDETTEIVNVGRRITPGGAKYRFCFITFNHLYEKVDVTYDNPYFRLDTKMPCPKEQMIIFIKDDKGRYLFDKELELNLYYPNIYEVIGLEEGETAKVIIFQDETELSQSEKYVNDIALYEKYIDLLPRYEDNSISELLKHYQPSSFVYSIDDYKGSIYVPSTMNYKVQKLHKTIYKNPWVLATYLDLLNLPTDKFYLDMEKIELGHRVRTDTTNEELDSGTDDVYFKDERYVFAMNRHLVDNKVYGFRIFIDGYFQNEQTYTVLPGPNFYYIYIPTKNITSTTVIEIERYKLFMFERFGSTDDIEKPVIELDLSVDKRYGYSREIYIVDTETSRYLNKTRDFRIKVLYDFAENGNKWTTIPEGVNMIINNKVRIYLKNETYKNRKLKIGIARSMCMMTGKIYRNSDNIINDQNLYEYAEVKMPNTGGYDIGGYRVFNNGQLMLPNQYYIATSRFQGSDDVIHTSCKLYEGDKFTVDRVPARFRVIYYQNEIDEENKKGFVDLDGKVPLPISLKWYDIYLNGIKLHKKNIDIVSPTKFYIQGTNSRKHLVIIVRNRDDEVFRLPSHDPEIDSKDYNNTIIDDLMEEINGLKEIIDGTKKEIDPDNETKEIATGICNNINGLLFFYEYLIYTFINANWRQITQDIKDTFPSFIDEQGILEIDPNEGCIKGPDIGGYLIKMIECNILTERSADMFTDSNVKFDGAGALQDRFAIRPLNTTNYEFGIPQEFMCDPETGEPAIMNDDGTVTTVSTIFRVKNFIESFSNNIMLYGMGKSDIYQITFDDEFKVHVYEEGSNLLSETIETGKEVSRFAIGIDFTFLTKLDESRMLKVADTNPNVIITYLDGDEEKKEIHKFNRLHNHIFEASNNNVTLVSIKCEGIPANVKAFVHSLLIAF